MYYIIEYNSLSIFQKTNFFDFLKLAKDENRSSSENMWDENWINKKNTLPYILENTDRFKKNGVFNVLFNNKEIIACSGIYKSNFCENLAIAGTRTWVKKNYRNKLISREYLLPIEKKWAIKNNFKSIGLCFNEYNKNIIEIWKRRRLGENRTNRQSYHLFFNNFNEVKFPIEIQYTKQWLIYEKLDDSFNFDWSTIEWSKK